MQLGNVWQVPRPRVLLPEPLRVAGAALLAACVAALLAAFAAGRGDPGPLDTALDPRIHPSGHATSSFALAAVFAILIADPLYRRVPGALRLALVLLALLVAGSVAAAMIATGAHTVTDAIAGAAVGTGVVLSCALTLDLATRRASVSPAAPPAPPAA